MQDASGASRVSGVFRFLACPRFFLVFHQRAEDVAGSITGLYELVLMLISAEVTDQASSSTLAVVKSFSPVYIQIYPRP